MTSITRKNGHDQNMPDMAPDAFWQPRRASTLSIARRHSAFIKVLRRILLSCALGVVGLLAWYFTTTPKSLTPVANADITVKMVNPIYKGRTSDGLSYRISAKDAVRYFNEPDEVKLAKPILNFLRHDTAQESVVYANVGLYDNKEHILELRDNVYLNTDDGYKCTTNHSRIFIKGKRIEGDTAIDCVGSFGKTYGNAYEISDDYQAFVFKDGMTAHLVSAQSEEELRGPASPTDVKNSLNTRKSFGTQDPVDIIANRALYKGAKISLTGNVIVHQDNVSISANRMELYREKQGKTESGDNLYGDVKRIEAIGSFKYSNATSTVSGDKGVYERNKNIITVTGNVTYSQVKGNSVSGCKLVYDLTTNRAKFDGSCRNKKNKTGRVVIKTGQ